MLMAAVAELISGEARLRKHLIKKSRQMFIHLINGTRTLDIAGRVPLSVRISVCSRNRFSGGLGKLRAMC